MRNCRFFQDKYNPGCIRIKVERVFIGKIENNKLYIFNKKSFYLICQLPKEIVDKMIDMNTEETEQTIKDLVETSDNVTKLSLLTIPARKIMEALMLLEDAAIVFSAFGLSETTEKIKVIMDHLDDGARLFAEEMSAQPWYQEVNPATPSVSDRQVN